MVAPLFRRSLLRYSGLCLFGLLAGCSTDGQQTAVPIFVDNRDSASRDVRISITGTADTFNTEVSVPNGAVVKVTEVEADSFCLRADVLGLSEGVLEDCPSAGDSDYSASGSVVIITAEPNERGQRWTIEPILNANFTASSE